jgi:hypothetical protein
VTKGITHSNWRDPTDRLHPPGYGDAGFQSVHALGREADDPAVVIVKYPPGRVIPVHAHDTDYCSVVVEGSVEVTRRVERVGDIRVVRAGTAYGPLVVGPEGCTVIDIFASRAGIPANFVRAEDRARAGGPPLQEYLALVARTLADASAADPATLATGGTDHA